MIDDRVARFLVRRQVRTAKREALMKACGRSWLDAVPSVSSGARDIVLFGRGAAVSELAIVAAQRRAEREAATIDEGSHGLGLGFQDHFSEIEIDEADLDRRPLDAPARRVIKGHDPRVAVEQFYFDIPELVAAARSLGEPMKIDGVACALLLAKAVGGLEGGFATVRQAFKAPRPIIVVISPVLGFQTQLQLLLENAEILPRSFELRAAPTGLRMAGRLAVTKGDYRPAIIDLRADEENAPGKLSIAAAFETTLPILLQARSLANVPKRIREAATLVLDAGYFDGDVLTCLIEFVRGIRPSLSVSDDLAAALDFTDLCMAVRPGLDANAIVETLVRYAEENRQELEPAQREDRRGRVGAVAGGGRASPPSHFIEPSEDPTAPRIETLPGFDAATAWALDLKADLALWRGGHVRWSDLSPKILLAGPPGVGKTTWARALGTSLGLPLLVTSAAKWVSAGHLGDVLSAMNAAFADACLRSPSILFLDEVDGLGSRENVTSRNDDFWVSIVNNALTLLDGAAKTEGVIVVAATNRPSVLDPAITRAGRLEHTIEVTRPSRETLAAIFRHHLGDDLASVAADYRQALETL